MSWWSGCGRGSKPLSARPDRVAEHIEAYAGAGVGELMLQWTDVEAFNRLRKKCLPREVLPRLERQPPEAHSHGTGRRE